jgi:hypothetical protein
MQVSGDYNCVAWLDCMDSLQLLALFLALKPPVPFRICCRTIALLTIEPLGRIIFGGQIPEIALQFPAVPPKMMHPTGTIFCNATVPLQVLGSQAATNRASLSVRRLQTLIMQTQPDPRVHIKMFICFKHLCSGIQACKQARFTDKELLTGKPVQHTSAADSAGRPGSHTLHH